MIIFGLITFAIYAYYELTWYDRALAKLERLQKESDKNN